MNYLFQNPDIMDVRRKMIFRPTNKGNALASIAWGIALCIITFCSPACKKKETDPELSVSTPTLTFGAAEETKTFEVNSNVDWSLSGDPAWLNVAPKSGKGKVAVTVTAQANAGAVRDATLTVTVKGKSAPVKVTQAAAADYAIAIASAGLGSLKVGVAASGAAITYTLTGGEYAATITAAHFAVTGLPAGLTAAAATRTSATTVTVAITGTPTAATATAAALSFPETIPAANIAGASAAIVPTAPNVPINVAKGDGATATQPTVSGTPTASSITVTGVFLTPNTGQPPQFAITTSSGTTAPTGGWQSSATFNGLVSGTDYYVWVRAVENANYNAGEPVRSAAIRTAGATVPSIEVTATGLNNLKVGQTVSGASVVFTLANGTYAATIIPADFIFSGLPAGLTAATATRTNATTVTVAISGAPTTASASSNITVAGTVPQANVAGATAPVAVTNATSISGVAPADDAPPAAPNPTLPNDMTIENL